MRDVLPYCLEAGIEPVPLALREKFTQTKRHCFICSLFITIATKKIFSLYYDAKNAFLTLFART